jgi:glycosyltransferase involved in cell wall biosynthesis
MSEVVGVGVPAYRGAAYIAEALKCLQQQTHRDLAVLISVDGADEETAAACTPFLADSRFKLVVQPTRLGWARNTSWVMAQNECPFWHYLAQDDLVDPDYVSTLLAYARANPQAAVTFCDIQCFDRNTDTIRQNPVLGSPAAREIALITAHHAAVALRGLTRQYALQHTGGLRENEVESFSADTAWMASVARAGELHRVPGARYRKRYHRDNVHSEWPAWPLARRLKAWQVHCRDMFLDASQVEATLPDCRLIWAATMTRLVSADLASGYIPASTFDAAARIAMLDGFLASFAPRHVADTEAKLDLPFDQIADLGRALHGARRQPVVERLRSLFRGA